MTTNTLTKPYQGRTYLATLAVTGRKVIITVEAGYTRDGGEIARLQALAEERYGFEVAGAEIVDPAPVEEDRGTGRWWAVELATVSSVADLMPDGEYQYGQLLEQDRDFVFSPCPGMILATMADRAPGWHVTEFAPSAGPDAMYAEIPW
jgi:hypothetical protein